VSEPIDSLTENPPRKLAARAAWTILILATLYVCYFSNLGIIGFVGPDEPRYAWIARDMAETGDWVTPRLYGRPWFEKPPLYYWGAATSFKLFGVSEASARLPSALSALLATLALAWLALRVYGSETARWLLLLLPTTVAMIAFSHAASTDMPFSAMLTIAMVCAAVPLGLTRDANHSPVISKTPWLALVLSGAFLGAAVLAKGPAAVILAGGAVFLWAFFTRQWRTAMRLLHPAAITAFCATALPWYILCTRRNPDFFRVFIIEHNFKRYLTPEFQHIHPFWYYLPILLGGFLPWTAIVVWSAVAGTLKVARTKTLSSAAIFFIAWAGFCLVFFSASKSKLPGYVLPAVPAIALLTARCCTSFAVRHRKSLGMTLIGFVVALGAIVKLMDYVHFHFAADGLLWKDFIPALVLIVALGNAIMGVGYAYTAKGKMRNLLVALSVVPFLLLMAMGQRLPEALANRISPRALANEIAAQHIPANQIKIYGDMGRGFRYGLNFYLHAELQDWESPAAETYALSAGRRCSSLRSDLQSNGLDCLDVPLGVRGFGWFISHIQARILTDHPAGSRQPQ
jgi:4-amino-4-deoxy-L-arabinose transferase-like glycosyltransferase